MADVLSQSQIDDLLKSINTGGEKAIEEIEVHKSEKKIKPYDFKMPKKFTKERMRVLDRIFEIYSRLLSSYFTGLLRLYCKVGVLQIEEQRYYEFNVITSYSIHYTKLYELRIYLQKFVIRLKKLIVVRLVKMM